MSCSARGAPTTTSTCTISRAEPTDSTFSAIRRSILTATSSARPTWAVPGTGSFGKFGQAAKPPGATCNLDCSGLNVRYLRACTRRRRNVAEPNSEISRHRHFQVRRSCGRAPLDSARRHRLLCWRSLGAPAADLFTRNAPGVAWKSKPSWYIVATKDRTVQPELERFLAKRMGATVTEVESSHVVMLSKPSVVTEVILSAARSVAK